MGRKNKKKDIKTTSHIAPSEPQEVNSISPLFSEDIKDTIKFHNAEQELQTFRNQWKNELQHKSTGPQGDSNEIQEEDPVKARCLEEELEKKATSYFLQAVELERAGDMSEAVQKYTKAFKLVPDIERRVYPPMNAAPRTRSPRKTYHELNAGESNNLYKQIESKLLEKEKKFEAASAAPCYMNTLPTELLEMITRYVVSVNLHHRDLTALSETSAFFYLSARSSDLWRRIFLRSVCPNTSRRFLTDRPADWRHLYMTTPHIFFHGIYAAKTSYIRHGETGFQDEFYRPWHTVSYYRLIRFYPDGHVQMMTTSEQPASAVLTFKRSSGKGRSDVMQGDYYIDGEYIIAEVFRERENNKENERTMYTKKKKSMGNFVAYGVVRQSFSLKLKMVRVPVSGLVWEKNVSTSWLADGSKNTCDLEVKNNSQQFPPHRFYPVKSFTNEDISIAPLE